MELYVALLHVISIFAVSGSTLGDHADVDCTLAQRTDAKSLHETLFDSLDKCFGKIANLDFEELNSISAYYIPLEQITEYCGRKNLIENCLSTISTSSSACHNETEREEFLFLEDVLKTALNYSCVDNGLVYASVIFGVFHEENSTTERNPVRDCIDTPKSTSPAEDGDTGILRLYREMTTFKRCLVERLRGINRSVFLVELTLNRILRSMKCHRPVDDTTVPCDTLSTTPFTDDKVCLFKGGDNDQQPRFTKMVDYAAECVKVNVNQLNFQSLQEFNTLEEYQTFMSTYCQNRPLILNCLGDVASNSKVCLNETLNKAVQTTIETVKHALETGCQADGVNLATMLHGIFSHKERTVSNDTLWHCLRTADDMIKSGSNAGATIVHEIAHAYHIVATTKRCILDRASEEGTFKSVFATFMNEILTDAKCVHLEDETVVPCSTLVNN